MNKLRHNFFCFPFQSSIRINAANDLVLKVGFRTVEAFVSWGGGHDVSKGTFHGHCYGCQIAGTL